MDLLDLLGEVPVDQLEQVEQSLTEKANDYLSDVLNFSRKGQVDKAIIALEQFNKCRDLLDFVYKLNPVTLPEGD